MSPLEVVEDLRLWDPLLTSTGSQKCRPCTAAARQKRFMDARNCEGRAFDTSHVWTFHFWWVGSCLFYRLGSGVSFFGIEQGLRAPSSRV